MLPVEGLGNMQPVVRRSWWKLSALVLSVTIPLALGVIGVMCVLPASQPVGLDGVWAGMSGARRDYLRVLVVGWILAAAVLLAVGIFFCVRGRWSTHRVRWVSALSGGMVASMMVLPWTVMGGAIQKVAGDVEHDWWVNAFGMVYLVGFVLVVGALGVGAARVAARRS